jgi:hypothetical protein
MCTPTLSRVASRCRHTLIISSTWHVIAHDVLADLNVALSCTLFLLISESECDFAWLH